MQARSPQVTRHTTHSQAPTVVRNTVTSILNIVPRLSGIETDSSIGHTASDWLLDLDQYYKTLSATPHKHQQYVSPSNKTLAAIIISGRPL